MNIAKNLETASLTYPDFPALIFEEKVYNYRAVEEFASRSANLLAGLGVRQGDRVALFLPNIPQFVFAYFGILKLGAIAVSINSRLRVNEVKFIVEDSSPVVIITSNDLLDNLPHPESCHAMVVGGQNPDHLNSFDNLLSTVSPERISIDLEPDAPAAILYTSGTTGTPKGATLSHNNVISNVVAANHHCRIKHGDRMLLFVPLFHCFGQNAIMNCAFAAGATIVLHRQFASKEILESIQKNRVTNFYGVPTAFVWLMNADLTGFDLSSISYYFSAAAKLPIEIAQKWHEHFGLPIFEGYGLTETSPFSSYNHNSDYRLGSVGTPIQQVDIQVWDEDGNQVAPGQLGEIVIRGPNIMLGYWNRPEDTANAIRNGWFHSGDIGSVDQEGYIYLKDRLKDMINISGLKVYPAEVENVLYQHPAVHEAAVYGIPDELTGEAVWATVVLKAGQQVTDEDLITFCTDRIASFKVPRVLKFTKSIPKNPAGKVLKRVLVADAQLAMAK